MRIRKVYQGNLADNKIVNAASNSQTNTYSCDYINTKASIYCKSLANNSSITFNGSNRGTYLITTTSNSSGTKSCFLLLTGNTTGAIFSLNSGTPSINVSSNGGTITVENTSSYTTKCYIVELANDDLNIDNWK